jgi:hypothetical protein
LVLIGSWGSCYGFGHGPAGGLGRVLAYCTVMVADPSA